ncbi:MAG TPA: DUF2231 domain-containing protein [Pyrinomonadaceae bacterium]|nr:DUF2231 domain-containing protein [Pyrinomonadaceae bacterium]
MESKAKALGHPIHQMLIPFPFGLLSTAVIFDIVYLIWGYPTMVTVSFWMIIGGIIGGLIAAPFGLIDWLAIPQGTRAKSVGLLHGLGNVVVLILFAASCWLRYGNATAIVPYVPTTVALVLSFVGFALAGGTGWLGGELVDRLSVGVDDGASLNAVSSLSGPATRKAA